MMGQNDRLRMEQDARAWLAWHIVAMTRAKKMPRLQSLMTRKKERRPQTVHQQMHVMQAWAAKVEKAQHIRKQLDEING